MKFTLFSTIEFEVNEPIALVECFCIQTNFYSSYDLLIPNRTIKDVGKIGGRIDRNKLSACKKTINIFKNMPIFRYDKHGLDEFIKLNNTAISKHVSEAGNVVNELMGKGIGLSQALKILHTVYPAIMPMIDSMLQEQYRLHIDTSWKETNPEQILFDYYVNLKSQPTRQNLDDVCKSINLPCLTKVRVFDIIWWSYLRANKVKARNGAIRFTSLI